MKPCPTLATTPFNIILLPLTSSCQEYKDVFEPLVLEECGAQIMRGMEEGEVLAPHRAVVGAAEQVGEGRRIEGLEDERGVTGAGLSRRSDVGRAGREGGLRGRRDEEGVTGADSVAEQM